MKIFRTLLALVFFVALALAQTNNARMLSGLNYQTGTTYTFVAADATRITSFSNASPIAATLPAGTNTGFGAGYEFAVVNKGTGSLTITCSSCTISGAGTLVLTTGQSAELFSDGVNYVAALGAGAGGGGGGLPSASAAGQLPASTGAGTTYAAQSKPVIDVRDLAGVDCTGATDSSTALNNLTDSRLGGNITGQTVQLANCPLIRLNSPWTIYGQSYYEVRGSSRSSFTQGQGSTIIGCGTSATGAVLFIERSGHAWLSDFSVYAKGNSCTSTFTQSIGMDNQNTGAGVTTTDTTFENIGVASNTAGTHITNYKGFAIGTGADQNVEDIRIFNSFILCQFSTGSIGVDIEPGTSDNDLISHNTFSACFHHIRIAGGGARIEYNKMGEGGDNSVFGVGGSNIDISGCSQPIVIFANEAAEGSAQFISNGPGGPTLGGCSKGLIVIGNQYGPTNTTLNSTVYPIDVGNQGAPRIFIGNAFEMNNATGLPIIGNDGQIPLGTPQPLGSIYSTSNYITNSAAGLVSSAVRFQGGEVHDNPGGSGPLFRTFQLNMSNTGNNGGQFNASSMLFRMLSSNGTNFVPDSFVVEAIPEGGQSNTLGTENLAFLHNISGGNPGAITLGSPVIGLQLSSSNDPLPAIAGRLPPFSVLPIGGTAGTTWCYKFVANTITGHSAASQAFCTTTGVASLSSSTYNRLDVLGPVPGAITYDIYRTTAGGTPNTTGKIATVSAIIDMFSGTNSATVNGGLILVKDTGLAGDATTPPAANTTGGLSLTSYTFANLPTDSSNGTMFFCSDCKNVSDDTTGTFDSAAASGGHGTNVLRENGAWRVH